MKILAIEPELPGNPDTAFAPHLKQEALRAWELHQKGIIRELYFMQDKPCAVLVLECDSCEQAGEILATLPLVKEGLIDFSLIPLKAYPGFSRLFSD